MRIEWKFSSTNILNRFIESNSMKWFTIKSVLKKLILLRFADDVLNEYVPYFIEPFALQLLRPLKY